ncbi:MAG: PilZ domain-containing protein [Pseudomonadales bacterium]|nr:PilZ domain-containing protein [Pseudomonadales bacterium]
MTTPLNDNTTNNQPVSIKQLKEIVSYFPIGDRVRYFPEYQPEMTMESLVLGYEINGHIIYSQNRLDILHNADEKGRIKLNIEGQELAFSKIHSFCILLPGKAGEEYKLNFLSKASLGSRGQFRNGNAITLIARYQERGAIIVETSVRESILPKESYYRNHQLVLLDVLATSLEISEQRTHHRLMCHLPIKLELSVNQQLYNCILVSYSEVSAQIRFNGDIPLPSLLTVGDNLIMTLKLDQLHRTFVIKGSVMRCDQDSIIMSLQNILSSGQFLPFDLIQALDVKASLLQCPGIS